MNDDKIKKLQEIIAKSEPVQLDPTRQSKAPQINGIPFVGQPLKSSQEKMFILRLDPQAPNAKDIEFNQNDVLEIEECPAIPHPTTTGTLPIVRVWMNYNAPFTMLVNGNVSGEPSKEDAPLVRKVFKGQKQEANMAMRGCSCPSCSCSCSSCSCSCPCTDFILGASAKQNAFDGILQSNMKAVVYSGNFAGNISAVQWW